MEASRLNMLIHSERWIDLMHHLTTPEGQLELKRNSCDPTSRSPLHTICTLHPPLHVVQRIVALAPESVERADSYSQTCLHVAASWGASSQVIYFLARENRTAASTKDKNGNTPLHLLWEGGCFDATCQCSSIREKITSIKALAHVSPESTLIRDLDGHTALENVVRFGASAPLVKTLDLLTSEAHEKMLERLCREASKNGKRKLEKTKKIRMHKGRDGLPVSRVYTHGEEAASSRLQ